ncbi:MAG: hypothetical protein K2I08_04600 [Muribaculaceae bacterium]|nr:hypothetical protein [Muribaculaceae bacterium]
MKKAFLLSVALAATCTAFAANPTLAKDDAIKFEMGPKAPTMKKAPTRASGSFDFSYAGEVYTLTKLNGVTGGLTRVYLTFELSSEDIKGLAGDKVTGFTVCSPSNQNMNGNTITEGRFFYSHDLSKEEYTQDFTISKIPFDLNQISIDEPYTITGEEESIYFGYSFVVPKADNMYYLPYDGVTTPNVGAGYFGASNTEAFPTEFVSFAGELGALCMSITLEGKNFPFYAKFASMPDVICLPLRKNSTFPLTLCATSETPIKSVEMEYTLGGKTYVTNCGLTEEVPAGASVYFDAIVGFQAQKEKFSEMVNFKITKINGISNDVAGAEAEAKVAVVKEVPVHQTLIEEFTGTWCGYCTRGYAALEYIKENYPEFVVAAYHNNDPMQVTTNYPASISSFPSAALNRGVVVDPYYGTQTSNYEVPIVGDIKTLNSVVTPWVVKVDHEWESENVLVAKANVTNVVGFEDKKYKIAYILVADGLSGTTRSWFQSNNYATQQPQFIPQLNAFCRGGEYGKSSVSGLIFNDVVVSTTGIYGIDGSIPTTLDADEMVEHSISFDLSKISNALIPDKNKLRVIAAVVDQSGNVLNCAKNEVNDFDATSVAGISVENAPVEYYNLNGMKVANPSNGIFIRRQGNTATKVVLP